MHFLVCLWQFRGIAAVTCWWVFILQFLDTLLCVWWLLFRGISEATTPWSISRVSTGYGKCTQWALGYLHRYGLSSCSLRSFCCHQVWVFLLLLSFLDYVWLPNITESPLCYKTCNRKLRTQIVVWFLAEILGRFLYTHLHPHDWELMNSVGRSHSS